MACGATLTFKRSLEFDPFHVHSSKRRCISVANNAMMGMSSPSRQTHHKPSQFAEIAPKFSSEQIVARISTEVKRMHQQRRRLHANSLSPTSSVSETMISPTQLHKKELSSSLLASAATGVGCASALQCRDTPVLSLKQVGLVCERMMKEREDQLREEYDKVLSEKLNEQYEAFLKFNHDQLHRKFGESAASCCRRCPGVDE